MERCDHDVRVLIILGGGRAREVAAAQLVKRLPSVRTLILSSGELDEKDLAAIVRASGRLDVQVYADRRAVDTVSNCTTLATSVAAAGHAVVCLATSRAHCARARAIGVLVFGSCGVHVRVHALETEEDLNESWLRWLRDVVRACCYVTTGLDMSSVAALVYPSRAEDVRAWCQSRKDAMSALHEALSRDSHAKSVPPTDRSRLDDNSDGSMQPKANTESRTTVHRTTPARRHGLYTVEAHM